MTRDDVRITEQGNTFDGALVHDFLQRALAHDAAIDQVLDLVHNHLERRHNRTVVAASLKPILAEIIDAATDDDWQAIADQLITDAREAYG